MIFKNSVASCNSGYFLKQTKIHLSPVCTRSDLTGTCHSDFILETLYWPCAEQLSLPWGLRRGPSSPCTALTLEPRREPAGSVCAFLGLCSAPLEAHRSSSRRLRAWELARPCRSSSAGPSSAPSPWPVWEGRGSPRRRSLCFAVHCLSRQDSQFPP